MITLEWDTHESAAPYDSDRWAATDRGWLFANRETGNASRSYGSEYVTLGHYMAYSAHEDPSLPIHTFSCVTRESAWFATVSEAKAFIQNQASGRVARCFADEHRASGGHPLTADEIERETVDHEPRERP